jgi:arylsulfate sulfotransferase
MITFTAGVSDASSGVLWYRFRVRPDGLEYRTLKDFGPDNTVKWTASEHEGNYELEVTVRNRDTGESSIASMPFTFNSRLADANQPVINPTAHPLVMLYSAPPCAPPMRMHVEFTAPEGTTQATNSRLCDANGRSMNFYIAGLRPSTVYTARHLIKSAAAGTVERGPELTFSSGLDLPSLPVVTLDLPPPGGAPNPVLLQASLFAPTMATDLVGNVIWYYPETLTSLTRPQPGGRFFGFIENPAGDQSAQILREFDLAGMTLAETNAARVSEQLAASGRRPIGAFHHEAGRLSNGNIVVLASVEQILAGIQGSDDPVDVLGDMIIVLDSDLNVVWTWDAFDHLDVSRTATLDDQCSPGVCPPLFLAASANDWLHGNSVTETPDGNLLYSARSQDMVYKIDYQHGNGAGDVMWRLGLGGDFAIESSDPVPWFSHQHDPSFEPGSNTRISLFDNGNLRQWADPDAHSRGQVLELDEENRIARLVLNADLGEYSFALGAAQLLPGGTYHFDVGFLGDGSSLAIEVDPTGTPLYIQHTQAPQYRSFRMKSLYTGMN